jgi:hypothetical protein
VHPAVSARLDNPVVLARAAKLMEWNMAIANAEKWVDLVDRVTEIRKGISEELKRRIQVGDPSGHAGLLEMEDKPDQEKAVDHCEKAEKALREGHVIEAGHELDKCLEQIEKGAGGK